MKDQYALQLFLDSSKKDTYTIQNMVAFADFIVEIFDIKFNKLQYNIKVGNRIKTIMRTYSTKAVERLLALPVTDLIALTFDCQLKRDTCAQSVITLNFLLSFSDDFPSCIQLVLDPTIFRLEFPISGFNKCIEKALLLDFKLHHGMATFINEDKLPLMYLSGVKTPRMNQQERDLVDALTLNIREYKKKIWDIFEYNIISKTLLNTKFIDKIHFLLRTEQYLDMKEYIVFWFIDFPDLLRENETAFFEKRNVLRKMLSHEGRLMTKSE